MFKKIFVKLGIIDELGEHFKLFASSYVDAYRMVAVQLSDTFTDLKNIIQKSGMKLNLAEMSSYEPPEITLAKQAAYFMNKYDYKNALFYVNLALQINRENLVGNL